MIKKTQGFTLIELIITMIVISVAMTGVMSLTYESAKNSAGPIIYTQSVTLASGVMDELLAVPKSSISTGVTARTFTALPNYSGLVVVSNSALSGVALLNIEVTIKKEGAGDILLVAYR